MSLKDKFRKLERGQAMMEYWPTIPAAIAIVISAGMMVNFLKGGLSKTAEVLYRSSAGVQIEVCDTTSLNEQGPTVAENIGPHHVELVSVTYNPETDETTVTYEVTSGSPLIKSVTFDIPDAIGTDEIKVASESWSPQDDIVTGYSTKDKVHADNGLGNGADAQPPGMPPENDVVFTAPDGSTIAAHDHNMEITYPEGNSGTMHAVYDDGDNYWVYDGDGSYPDTSTTNTLHIAPPDPGNPGNKHLGQTDKPGKRTVIARNIPNLYLLQDASSTDMGFTYGESRDISFVLQGQVTFQSVNVTVWESQDSSYTSTIVGPVQVIDEGETTTVISCE
jgi:hypothetical protein